MLLYLLLYLVVNAVQLWVVDTSLGLSVFAPLGLGALLLALPNISKRFSPRIARVAIFLTLVLLYNEYRINQRIQAQLPSELESLTLDVEGRVSSQVEVGREFKRFLFQPDQWYGERVDNWDFRQGLWRLSWRTQDAVSPGTRWRLQVRLKRPRGFVNPGGFDYQAWLLSQNIVASGYIVHAEEIDAAPDTRQRKMRDSWRHIFLAKLDQQLHDLRYRNLVWALLTGDKSLISAGEWQLFQQTGTVHLMAISGLHIGLVAGLFLFWGRLIFRPLCFWFSLRTYHVMCHAVALSAAAYYAFLAGFSVPTQRALFCLMLVSLVILLGRRTSYLRLLLLVAVAILLVNPFAGLLPGFWLSFTAVASLVFALANRYPAGHKLRRFGQAQIVVTMALLPFLAAFALPIAFVSPLANTLAIPLLTFCILPCLMFGSIAFLLGFHAEWIFGIADVFLAWCLSALHWFAHFPLFVVAASSSIFLLLLTLVIALLAPKALCFRAAAGIALAAFIYSQWFAKVNHPSLTVLDVGQGLSTVVRAKDYTLVYDLGARFSETFSIASRVLLPYLQQRKVTAVDVLVVSHADNDHAGAFSEFVDSTKVKTIYSGQTQALGLSEANQCSKALAPFFSTHGDVQYEFLWPDNVLGSMLKSNNRSCVLLMRYRQYVVVFAGDIEKQVEYQLLGDARLPRDVDILIAPHHGSNTSSTEALINRLQPKHVVFSAGYKNRYRHPASKVVKRYALHGVQQWNTAYHGALTFEFGEDKLTVRASRCDGVRRWYLKEGFCPQ